MRTFVSLDLETTGLDAERDAILEIGIVKFRGDEVLEEYNAIIDPRRDIPPKIVELTGITQDMVSREGIQLWDGLNEARRVVGNHTIIGHNIAFDLNFLRRQRMFETNASLDTFELAGILVPHAGRYALGALANELGITLPATHRALDDARVAHQLYLRVFERAVELPRNVLEEIVDQSERSNWLLSSFWREALDEQKQGSFASSIGAQLRRKTGDGRRKADASVVLRRQAQLKLKPLEAHEKIEPLDVEEVAATLAPESAFAKKFAGFESRPQQAQMMRLIAQSFNDGAELNEDEAGVVALVEAGTGTGKSLAYLIPAMKWAVQNGERVVVSTNTINLQEQLMEKDVPAVIDALGLSEARAAVMKGKSRYVCPNRVDELRKGGAKTMDEARVLTKILIWQPNTLTGDADELFIPSPGERAVFSHLSAQNPACNMNTCSATGCYFHQARRLAENAHVVIVNHALLLADIAVENKALPEYKYLVIDEGHHLESAATDSLTYKIDRDEIGRNLGELGNPSSGRAKGKGLLGDVDTRVRNLPPDQSAAMSLIGERVANAAQNVWTRAGLFFDELTEFLSGQVNDAESDYAIKKRIDRAMRNSSAWPRVELACEQLIKEFNPLSKNLASLTSALSQLQEASPHIEADVLVAQLTGVTRFVAETTEQLTGIILKPQDKTIYWLELEANRGGSRGPRKFARRLTLSAAPLHVGPMLKQHIWGKKRATIVTSATIRTANTARAAKNAPTFTYIKERMSAEDAAELALGSPFDYKKSTLVYIASDVPEPNQQGYQQAVEKGLIALFRASQGRGMGLFTAYTQLRQTARVIAPELQKDDIIVLEQGDGTSRRAMLEQFRAADRAVLLGTRSFWEGVDVQGEKLSALAICKLPFDVPTDPIFAARSETYEDSFNEYSVPESVLKFRQGFGRLIRSKTDRGVVLILDKRVVSKGYGASFLAALPECNFVRGPISGIAQSVTKWLTTE